MQKERVVAKVLTVALLAASMTFVLLIVAVHGRGSAGRGRGTLASGVQVTATGRKAELSSGAKKPTQATSTLDASSACNDALQAYSAESVVAYQSTAGAVQTWKETRVSGEQPIYSALSPSEAAASVAVCYLSGSFSGIPSAPGAPDVYQQVIVEVDESSGVMTFDAASPYASWPFDPPPGS